MATVAELWRLQNGPCWVRRSSWKVSAAFVVSARCHGKGYAVMVGESDGRIFGTGWLANGDDYELADPPPVRREDWDALEAMVQAADALASVLNDVEPIDVEPLKALRSRSERPRHAPRERSDQGEVAESGAAGRPCGTGRS